MSRIPQQHPRRRGADQTDISAYALPLEKFSQHGDTLTAEISDLGNCRLDRPLFSGTTTFVVGIAIRSHHTSRVVRYYLEGEDKTPEGEIAGWRYRVLGMDAAGVRTPNVLIIND